MFSCISVSYTHLDKITLKYFQNSFMLDFSTLDYSDNGQIKYMYWLENYDKGWNVPSSLSFEMCIRDRASFACVNLKKS